MLVYRSTIENHILIKGLQSILPSSLVLSISFSSDKMPLHDPNFKVIIIGAGVSGLSLAQILRKAGIPFEVFERDDGSRNQGWCINLDT